MNKTVLEDSPLMALVEERAPGVASVPSLRLASSRKRMAPDVKEP